MNITRELKLLYMRTMNNNTVSDCLEMGLTHVKNFDVYIPSLPLSIWVDEKGREYGCKYCYHFSQLYDGTSHYHISYKPLPPETEF